MFATKSSLFGGTPPTVGSGGWLMQAGSSVDVSDVSGHAHISFTTPFPNGVLTIVQTIGDRPVTASIVTMDQASVSLSGFDIVCEKADLTGVVVGGEYRTNFIAIGW